MKDILALFAMVLLALASGRAAAQQSLMPSFDGSAGDLPPQMADDLPSGEDLGRGETIEPVPQSEGVETVESFGAYGANPMYLDSACAAPSLFESSGTWLRRGYWYAEGDFMLINRSWDKKGLLFAFEGGTSSAPGVAPGLGTPTFGQVLTLNSLQIDGSKPGADGMGRFSLGRFLFRDERNRDHAAEITFFGGGDWKQHSSITASSANGLNVNDFIDRINPSFDGARQMAFDYETGLDSLETNYIVKSRMGRDQMKLQPNGEWIRAAQTSHTYSFLTGLRYVRLSDALGITAQSDPNVATTEGGFYNVDTNNDLFGGQIGVAFAHETARWSVGLTAKGGSYWNRTQLQSQFRAGPDLIPSRGEVDSSEEGLSFVGEVQLLGKWHLRPNLSLRAGMEILYVSAVALAPHQVNFIPEGYDPIATSGDIFCIGSSFGIEAYR